MFNEFLFHPELKKLQNLYCMSNFSVLNFILCHYLKFLQLRTLTDGFNELRQKLTEEMFITAEGFFVCFFTSKI